MNWQKEFEKQLEIASNTQKGIFRRYYQRQFNKAIDEFFESGKTNGFETYFPSNDLVDLYRGLFVDVGLHFARWYSDNADRVKVKSFNQLNEDVIEEHFERLARNVSLDRVVIVRGTALKELERIFQQFTRNPDFMALGAREQSRIIRKKFESLSQYAVERIVRTESTYLANQGVILSADDIYGRNGYRKKWSSATDERTRPAHLEVGLSDQLPYRDEKFNVGGELMTEPGDPSASAANVINCRCSVTPVPIDTKPSFGSTAQQLAAIIAVESVLNEND